MRGQPQESITAVGVDVGGTTIKAVGIDANGTILIERRVLTPSPDPTGARVVAAVTALVHSLTDRTSPTGVVVPGVVDEARGLAVLSTNIGWRDLPLQSMLEKDSGRPIHFGHDVRAGALAEARWGAATGRTGVLAFVPIGTGIASAILIDAQPVVSGGWAGEIGQSLIRGGPFTGQKVETVASAGAIARRAGSPDARTVADLVAAGDPTATAVWDETITVLADALVTLTTVVAPETIVIGGGLALAGPVLLTPLTRVFAERLGSGLRRPELVQAKLGDRAAALGAAIIALNASGSAS